MQILVCSISLVEVVNYPLNHVPLETQDGVYNNIVQRGPPYAEIVFC